MTGGVDTFRPSVRVLSEQPRVLERPDLSFDALLRRFPGLAEADAVCVTGSVIAGWGNPYSDIDVYAFSDRELELPVDPTMEMWPGSDKSGLRWVEWIGRYGDTRVDLTVWPMDAVQIALAPLLGGAEPELYTRGETLEDFVYRLSIGLPLKGEDFLAQQRALIASTGYHRALARYSKIRAENALTDVAGQLAAGDDISARYTAIRVCGFTADACLLLARELCRGEKWLMRRLQSTPECGITLDDYRSMVLEGPRPGESDADCARRMARWAQAHLVRIEDELISPA